MNKRNAILGLDPGPKKCGWVLYNMLSQAITVSGHDEWHRIRYILEVNAPNLHAVCVEKVIMHMGLPPSRLIIDTATNVGRIQQLCDTYDIQYHEHARIDICEKVAGIRPKPGVKVSKKDMQLAVQKLLDAPEVIRPQHANDACAAILAEYPPDAKKKTQ